QIRDYLITLIDGIPALSGKVSLYRGEFEKDSGTHWNPEFPSCFIFMKGFTKDIEGTYGETLKKGYSYTVYVADRDDCAALVEQVYNALDSVQLELDQNFFNVNARLVKLLGYHHSVDVYMIELSVK